MEKSLAKHNAAGQAGIITQDQKPVNAIAGIHKASTCNDDICSSPRKTSSERPLLARGSASSMRRMDSCLMQESFTARGGELRLSGRRGPKRQQTSKSLFNFWFAQVEISSSTTEQEDDVESDYILPMRLQARRISVRIVPSLRFLKTCLLFESGDSTPTVSYPGWDNRLRLIRTHPRGSAVAKAIRCADYIRFRQLLQNREVSPFDLVENWDSERSSTLFEMVAFRYIGSRQSNANLSAKSIFDIAKLLADSGVDCGIGKSLYFVLAWRKHAPEDVTMSLVRMILTKSRTDPYECFHNAPYTIADLFLDISMFIEQDEWDVSELPTSYEKYEGQGSWQHMDEIVAGMGQWVDLQKEKWRQIPSSLRKSKSHCLVEFGSRFVEEEWAQLCWLDERPAFWRSKQACEELFGTHFVTFQWPELYWRQEIPIFWHSRKRCLEYFGSFFTEIIWRRCLGLTCFEHLEGKGAYERFYKFDWTKSQRNEWINQMVNRWLSDPTTLRHSRQHCIAEYGTNFVQDELPSLLRADKVPEAEVLRVTDYGPDMEPPPPHPYWVSESESGSESEEYEAEDWELCSDSDSDNDSDNDGDKDSESDEEMNDGWETADEG